MSISSIKFLLISLFLIIFHCVAQGQARKSALIGTWDFVEIGFDENKNGKIDSGEWIVIDPDDDLDAYVSFKENNRGEMIIPPMNESEKYKWELVNNGSDIKALPQGEETPYIFHIISFNKDQLSLSSFFDEDFVVLHCRRRK